MIRWSMLMILTVVSACCFAATNADDKTKPTEKAATKTEKAESKDSKESKPESAEKKAAPAKEKAKAADTKKDTEKDVEKKEGSDDKFNAKCPVTGEAASKEFSTTYKEKLVYFASKEQVAAFEAEPAKYEVKANHQLAQTKQFVQKKCPLEGGPIDKEQSARVSNVTVRFCCEKCKGAVQTASADEKLEMIFAEKAFKKGYVAAKVESKEDDAKEKPKAEKSENATEKKSDKPKEKKAAEKTEAK